LALIKTDIICVLQALKMQGFYLFNVDTIKSKRESFLKLSPSNKTKPGIFLTL